MPYKKTIFNEYQCGKASCKNNRAEQDDSFHTLIITAPRLRGCMFLLRCSGLDIFLITVPSTAAAISISEIALRAFFTRFGNIDGNCASHEILAIEHADGLLRLVIGCHFDETKSFGSPRCSVYDQCNRGDVSSLADGKLESIFSSGLR